MERLESPPLAPAFCVLSNSPLILTAHFLKVARLIDPWGLPAGSGSRCEGAEEVAMRADSNSRPLRFFVAAFIPLLGVLLPTVGDAQQAFSIEVAVLAQAIVSWLDREERGKCVGLSESMSGSMGMGVRVRV